MQDSEGLRQRGLRPLRPAYHETPLTSIGKTVRVNLPSGQIRRAIVEYVNEDGTVDVAFAGASVNLAEAPKDKGATEATVAADSLRPLHDEELSFEDEEAFEGPGAQRAKEVGNLVFKLGDMEAAAELYARALKVLERCEDGVEWVLANRHGSLQPARVCRGPRLRRRSRLCGHPARIATVWRCQRAPDRVDLKFCGTDEVLHGVPLSAVLGVRLDQLLLQGSLHLNRSRALAQLGHQAEAAQDLSIVISLWAAHAAAGSPRIGKDEECKEQLVKAFYLRAKTRMSRQRIEPARSDLAAAAALRPAEATATLLRQAERELEAVQKEKVRSNKKLAKEIAKFADSAMSGLSEAELAALGAATDWSGSKDWFIDFIGACLLICLHASMQLSFPASWNVLNDLRIATWGVMGKSERPTCGLQCLEEALRSLGEVPAWKQLPNTQQQHQCRGWKASVSHYSGKGTILVQGADAALVEEKLKTAIEVASRHPGTTAMLQASLERQIPTPQVGDSQMLHAREPVMPAAPSMEGESWYLYLDGACPNNRNVRDVAHSAGWGVAVFEHSPAHGRREAFRLFGPVEVHRSSAFFLGAEVCSNNTAELTAFGEALLWLRDEAPGPKERPAVLCYDSQYAKKAMTGENRAHANVDLVASVQRLWQEVSTRRRLQLSWIKGHAGDFGNELADKLANEGAEGSVSIRTGADELVLLPSDGPDVQQELAGREGQKPSVQDAGLLQTSLMPSPSAPVWLPRAKRQEATQISLEPAEGSAEPEADCSSSARRRANLCTKSAPIRKQPLRPLMPCKTFWSQRAFGRHLSAPNSILPRGKMATLSLIVGLNAAMQQRRSNIPVVLLWTVHAVTLAAAVAERVAVGRLVWHHGFAWLYIAQLSFLCTPSQKQLNCISWDNIPAKTRVPASPCWPMAASKILQALALALAVIVHLAVEPEELPAQGECRGGPLPAGCRSGRLRDFDWQTYLGLLCSELPRSVAHQAILQALARFDADNARACPEGFAVSMLALYATGASEFEDQVIRFKPDGSSHFLVLAWKFERGRAVLDHWSTSLPATVPLAPPWPSWNFPGPLQRLQQAQDLSQLKELPPSLHCDEQSLASIGCSEETPLLQALCSHCATNLPCTYSEGLLQLLSRAVEAAPKQPRSADSPQRPPCGHALLAALLALNGRRSTAAVRTDPELYRMGTPPKLVMHSTFKRVAQDPEKMFVFNVPLMDLSPFPFHTSPLRSARSDRPKGLYQDAIKAVSQSLERRGIGHVIVPGDASMMSSTADGVWSIFLPALSVLQAHLKDWIEADLNRELLGHWRLVHVSPGLWQIGEEPYRFSPRTGVAFRAFCPDCVYVSLYLYVQEEVGQSVFPLSYWVPCRLGLARLFPLQRKEELPLAADPAWLRRAASVTTNAGCKAERTRLIGLLPRVVPWPLGEDLWEDLDAAVMPAFDLEDGTHSDLGLFDLMRQREDSESPGLRRFSDKVLFKTWMLQEAIPIAEIFHMSNESPDVLAALGSLKTQRFVAKPTHLAATSYVYVMKDGINLVNGQSLSHEEINSGLREAWNERHVDDWATESTRPGVLIEELVESSERQGRTPDELKCQTFWGKLFFCEWTFVQNMSSGDEGSARFDDAHQQGDRAQPALGHQACGIPNFASNGYIFRDGSCLDCVAAPPLTGEAWKRMVSTIETIARGSDHIRIDVFVPGGGRFLVNEANISFLKISQFPAELVEEMRKRWLEGYLFRRSEKSTLPTLCAAFTTASASLEPRGLVATLGYAELLSIASGSINTVEFRNYQPVGHIELSACRRPPLHMLTWDAAAATVALPARLPRELERAQSAPSMPRLHGTEAWRSFLAPGFGAGKTQGRIQDAFVPDSRDYSKEELLATLFTQPRDAEGVPPPLGSLPFPRHLLSTTMREDFRVDRLGHAVLHQRHHGGLPAPAVPEDSWARGWRSTHVWTGRKKGLNAQYADGVRSPKTLPASDQSCPELAAIRSH
ncbi:rnhA [Symbiodinium microadriaticum]|nr:rnhA [Symbiodinium microadriaticum]